MKLHSIILLPLVLMSATSTVARPQTPLQTIELDRQMTNETVDKTIKTIKYIETKNDTKCIKRGASGEYGCFQILPSTWNHLTKKHLGSVKGFSVELERKVVRMEIEEQIVLKKLEPKQVFKLWNSGNLKPCSSGVNKWGVKYNSCKYVNEAMKIYNNL